MAAGVDTTTLQPQQPTNTFTEGSKMYVTFKLHPPSQGGAVCSIWYLNGTQATTNNFSVSAGTPASYLYAIYQQSGKGAVELYWASDQSCNDKMLAQHIDFPVTGP